MLRTDLPTFSIFDFAKQLGIDLYAPPSPSGAIVRKNTVPVRLAYDILPVEEKDELQSGVFDAYRPRNFRICGAHPHPTPLVESATLAAVPPPIPKYRPLLPEWLVSDGILSDAQLEAIALAGQAQERYYTLQEPGTSTKPVFIRVRGGFMVGDSTGVGKGRIGAGIILANWTEGRRKAIWISENSSLRKDAQRDWAHLGGAPDDFFLQNSYKGDAVITKSEGICFTTYATLRSKSKKGSLRWQQLVEWLSDVPDALIIIDESQNAANAVDCGPEFFDAKASQQGTALLELQAALPEARVVYMSATTTSKPQAFAYAPRLGLWGKDRPFNNREEFLASLKIGGTAGLEAICHDLKSLGLYVSRALSLDGVTFERLVHHLSPAEIKRVKTFNRVWQKISRGLIRALVDNNVIEEPKVGEPRIHLNGMEAFRKRSSFEGAKLRFYSLLLVSLQMPTVIADMRKRLAAGECCVIQLYNTHEASQERALGAIEREHGALDDGAELPEDLDLSPKSVLIDYLKAGFPTQKFEYAPNDNEDGPQTRPVVDADGNPVQNPRAVALRDKLIRDIDELLVPAGPLEILDEAFGDEIAELTGRKRRSVYRTNGKGERVRQLQVRSKSDNDAAVDDFMHDRKGVLIFSEATGGTGRSFHCDPNYPNQRKRNGYQLQMSFYTTKAYQGMGRINRANQLLKPHYLLCLTDMPGHMRFASHQARGVSMLGALCRGERDACSNGLFKASDNLETIYGRLALFDLLGDIHEKKIPGITPFRFHQQTGIDPKAARVPNVQRASYGGNPTVARFLNRLLAVDIDLDGGLQGRIWNAFIERIDARIEAAIAVDTFDAGVETIKPIHLRKIDHELIHIEPETRAKTYLVKLEREDPLVTRPFEEARAMLQNAQRAPDESQATFMRDDDGTVALHIPDYFGEVLVVTPFSKYCRKDSDGSTPITQRQALFAWKREIATAPPLTKRIFYVVSGSLLPIWRNLPHDTPKVYRMQTDAGERLMGRVLPATFVKALRAKLQPIPLAA